MGNYSLKELTLALLKKKGNMQEVGGDDQYENSVTITRDVVIDTDKASKNSLWMSVEKVH